MKNKLYPSFWVMLYKRIKFWLVYARPIPLIYRRKCKSCGLPFSSEVSLRCPHCGHGPGTVWVVTGRHGYIYGCFLNIADAQDCADDVRSDGFIAAIEGFDLQ